MPDAGGVWVLGIRMKRVEWNVGLEWMGRWVSRKATSGIYARKKHQQLPYD